MPRPQPAPLNSTLVTLPKGRAAPAGVTEAEPERIGITTRLTPDVHERLRKLAFDLREPKGKTIERAVLFFLDQQGA